MPDLHSDVELRDFSSLDQANPPPTPKKNLGATVKKFLAVSASILVGGAVVVYGFAAVMLAIRVAAPPPVLMVALPLVGVVALGTAVLVGVFSFVAAGALIGRARAVTETMLENSSSKNHTGQELTEEMLENRSSENRTSKQLKIFSIVIVVGVAVAAFLFWLPGISLLMGMALLLFGEGIGYSSVSQQHHSYTQPSSGSDNVPGTPGQGDIATSTPSSPTQSLLLQSVGSKKNTTSEQPLVGQVGGLSGNSLPKQPTPPLATLVDSMGLGVAAVGNSSLVDTNSSVVRGKLRL